MRRCRGAGGRCGVRGVRLAPPAARRRTAAPFFGFDVGRRFPSSGRSCSGLEPGWECVGIRDGLQRAAGPGGLPRGRAAIAARPHVRAAGITHLGGTILGTTNRGNPLRYPVARPDGHVARESTAPDELVGAASGAQGIDALISIGGDGSLAIAHDLCRKGLPVVGVPKTIDNDLDRTVLTFGFDTAVTLRHRVHRPPALHGRVPPRVLVVEVMGRYAGWIALHCRPGRLGGRHPDPRDPLRHQPGRRESRASGSATAAFFSIVVVAEGAAPKTAAAPSGTDPSVGKVERLGGVGHKVSAELEKLTGKETRVVVLGHLLRGGVPTSQDRLISLRFGAAAVQGAGRGALRRHGGAGPAGGQLRAARRKHPAG